MDVNGLILLMRNRIFEFQVIKDLHSAWFWVASLHYSCLVKKTLFQNKHFSTAGHASKRVRSAPFFVLGAMGIIFKTLPKAPQLNLCFHSIQGK